MLACAQTIDTHFVQLSGFDCTDDDSKVHTVCRLVVLPICTENVKALFMKASALWSKKDQ